MERGKKRRSKANFCVTILSFSVPVDLRSEYSMFNFDCAHCHSFASASQVQAVHWHIQDVAQAVICTL